MSLNVYNYIVVRTNIKKIFSSLFFWQKHIYHIYDILI
jgi:hypothetical protein